MVWLQKAEVAAVEKNRAAAVAMNAEVRRIKARLMDEVPKLQKLAKKKVKDLSKEELEARNDLVLVLPERIQAIPDGATSKQTQGWGASSSHKNIKFDSELLISCSYTLFIISSKSISDGPVDGDFFQQTEEASQFRQEFEMRKMKQACSFLHLPSIFGIFIPILFISHIIKSVLMQDEGLDIISEGLDTLKNLAKDMNEELDRQVPLIDEIDTKVDKTTSDLRRNNVRLKETLTKVRSTRNFCIDIILLCILLGIATYLYHTNVKPLKYYKIHIFYVNWVGSRYDLADRPLAPRRHDFPTKYSYLEDFNSLAKPQQPHGVLEFRTDLCYLQPHDTKSLPEPIRSLINRSIRIDQLDNSE
ncbi:hypothetical protein CDL12_13326 [Handroanthus impetiginosus]|uniref:t-SNARE coiled-coil homology domain-containing protein n=1 Tax=Handroanthus impetiginosus TaxID=429701 RepID=A0A2G9H952_9LAMI|nr:hypothetical protein CDL12_13326 [Handroanthus impetiginosus]